MYKLFVNMTRCVFVALFIGCILDCTKEINDEKGGQKISATTIANSNNGNGYLQNMVVSKETMKSMINDQNERKCFKASDITAAFDLADEMKIFQVSRKNLLIYSTKDKNEILSLRNSILITETKKCQTCLCDYEKIIYLYKDGRNILDINIIDRNFIRYGDSPADAPLDNPKVFEKWFIDRKMTIQK